MRMWMAIMNGDDDEASASTVKILCIQIMLNWAVVRHSKIILLVHRDASLIVLTLIDTDKLCSRGLLAHNSVTELSSKLHYRSDCVL